MSELQIEHNDLQLATQLHDQGMEQLDNLILEEQAAKLMTIAGLVVGENVLYAGNPGGGKSTLTENLYRLVGGIDASDVADVPHRSDLTSAQLVGDTIDAVKRTSSDDGQEKIERISSDVIPIISQDSKIIRFDEINRLNTYAINAALRVLASRSITIRHESVPLKNLEMVISAMNPGESLRNSFRMADALVSRQAMGVVLGSQLDAEERKRVADKIWAGWVPTPEAMESAITLDGLHSVRRAARKVIVNDEMRKTGSQVGLNINDALTEAHVPEADGRINVQLRSAAQALALLRGRQTVNGNDIHEAANFLVTARFSAIGKTAEQIKPIIDQVAA